MWQYLLVLAVAVWAVKYFVLGSMRPKPGWSRLPDGREFYSTNPNSADNKLIIHEIFTNDCYFDHGIGSALRAIAKPVVFDVGANIGLFAIAVSKIPGVRVHCFEPIPEVAAACTQNVAKFLNAQSKVHTIGLGDKQAADKGELLFRYFPFVAVATSMLPEVKMNIDPMAVLKAQITDFVAVGATPAFPSLWIVRALDRPILGKLVFLLFVLPMAVAFMLRRAIRRRLHTYPVRCPIRTLSQVMAAEGIDRIDLLKVDAEGAETLVLKGIEDRDWPKIQRVVLDIQVILFLL